MVLEGDGLVGGGGRWSFGLEEEYAAKYRSGCVGSSVYVDGVVVDQGSDCSYDTS